MEMDRTCYPARQLEIAPRRILHRRPKTISEVSGFQSDIRDTAGKEEFGVAKSGGKYGKHQCPGAGC